MWITHTSISASDGNGLSWLTGVPGGVRILSAAHNQFVVTLIRVN